MSIAKVYNSFKWLVTPLVGLMLACQALALCVVLAAVPHHESQLTAPVHPPALSDVGTKESLHGSSSHDADLGIQSASEQPTSTFIPHLNSHSYPHSADHDCCNDDTDTMRVAVLIVLWFAIALRLIRPGDLRIFSFFFISRYKPHEREAGYPRPHLVHCKLLN